MTNSILLLNPWLTDEQADIVSDQTESEQTADEIYRTVYRLLHEGLIPVEAMTDEELIAYDLAMDTLSLAQLVTIYNYRNPDKQVNRFTDKKTALRRLGAESPPVTPKTVNTIELITPLRKNRVMNQKSIITHNPLIRPSKTEETKGGRVFALIPNEPTPVHILASMGVTTREIWWSWCLGYLLIDGERWEDTEHCTAEKVCRWHRKDLYASKVPDGFSYTSNKGKKKHTYNFEQDKIITENQS